MGHMRCPNSLVIDVSHFDPGPPSTPTPQSGEPPASHIESRTRRCAGRASECLEREASPECCNFIQAKGLRCATSSVLTYVST